MGQSEVMRKFRIALLVCGLALAAGAAFSVALYTPPVGTWRPVRPEPGFVQQAYTGQPAVKETYFNVLWLAAGPDGTLYVNQDRASRGAGDERATPDATEIVMLRPDGSAGVLEEPIVDGLQVEEAYILAVGDDGTAYLYDRKNGRLVARAPDRTWRALTAAQDWEAGHDGDGGPALQATSTYPAPRPSVPMAPSSSPNHTLYGGSHLTGSSPRWRARTPSMRGTGVVFGDRVRHHGRP